MGTKSRKYSLELSLALIACLFVHAGCTSRTSIQPSVNQVAQNSQAPEPDFPFDPIWDFDQPPPDDFMPPTGSSNQASLPSLLPNPSGVSGLSALSVISKALALSTISSLYGLATHEGDLAFVTMPIPDSTVCPAKGNWSFTVQNFHIKFLKHFQAKDPLLKQYADNQQYHGPLFEALHAELKSNPKYSKFFFRIQVSGEDGRKAHLPLWKIFEPKSGGALPDILIAKNGGGVIPVWLPLHSTGGRPSYALVLPGREKSFLVTAVWKYLPNSLPKFYRLSQHDGTLTGLFKNIPAPTEAGTGFSAWNSIQNSFKKNQSWRIAHDVPPGFLLTLPKELTATIPMAEPLYWVFYPSQSGPYYLINKHTGSIYTVPPAFYQPKFSPIQLNSPLRESQHCSY